MANVRFLIVSPRTYRRFEDFARTDCEARGRGFQNTAQYQPTTDQWVIPLSDEVSARLEGRRSPGQSDDELLNEVMTALATSNNMRQ
jgi:hypothetical protein